jgi:hypothetical protein
MLSSLAARITRFVRTVKIPASHRAHRRSQNPSRRDAWKAVRFPGLVQAPRLLDGLETRTTGYGGRYADANGRSIVVNPKSGVGDVVAKLGRQTLSAACKSGIINTRHAGQVSRLYRGLCEIVGHLMATPSPGRQVAVVPYTDQTKFPPDHRLRPASKGALFVQGETE